jgi:serine/threonine protein kinase
LVEIVDHLLSFNPYFRPTARELLKHPIFDSVRIKENEIQAKNKIVMELDRKNPVDYTSDDNNDQEQDNSNNNLINEIKIDVIVEIIKLRKMSYGSGDEDQSEEIGKSSNNVSSNNDRD